MLNVPNSEFTFVPNFRTFETSFLIGETSVLSVVYSLGLRAFCALEWLAQKELYSLKWFT